jgi:aspartate racemase
MILGCTELCLLIQADDSSRPLYDTTALHAKAILRFALDEPASARR